MIGGSAADGVECTQESMALVVKRARSPTGDAEGALIESKKPKSDALSVGAVPRTSSGALLASTAASEAACAVLLTPRPPMLVPVTSATVRLDP